MSERQSKLPVIEIAIFVLIVIAAVVAWQTRASRAATSAATAQRQPANVAPSGPRWAPKAGPRARHASPLSREATDRSEQLCREMVASQAEFRLKQPVAVIVRDVYGVGDVDSGAGDSLIVEGTATVEHGTPFRYHCAMAHLGGYGGTPVITFPDTLR